MIIFQTSSCVGIIDLISYDFFIFNFKGMNEKLKKTQMDSHLNFWDSGAQWLARPTRYSTIAGSIPTTALLRRECNLLTAVKGFKVDLEASRT